MGESSCHCCEVKSPDYYFVLSHREQFTAADADAVKKSEI